VLHRSYAASLTNFVNAVHNTEQEYANLTNFPLNAWRNWSLASPRVAAVATQTHASNPNVPLVGLPNPVTAVAGGFAHSLALCADGTVVGWGDKTYGQTTSPAAATNLVALAGGYGHTLALKANGTVVGWGDNGSGQLNMPGGLNNVAAIAAGFNHNLALKSDGTVVGWGANFYSQTNIPGDLRNVVAVAAGVAHSLALKADGTVVGWGLNATARLSFLPI
jgi:alpha-tubulin suppressor-like RCC1 family protein